MKVIIKGIIMVVFLLSTTLLKSQTTLSFDNDFDNKFDLILYDFHNGSIEPSTKSVNGNSFFLYDLKDGTDPYIVFKLENVDVKRGTHRSFSMDITTTSLILGQDYNTDISIDGINWISITPIKNISTIGGVIEVNLSGQITVGTANSNSIYFRLTYETQNSRISAGNPFIEIRYMNIYTEGTMAPIPLEIETNCYHNDANGTDVYVQIIGDLSNLLSAKIEAIYPDATKSSCSLVFQAGSNYFTGHIAKYADPRDDEFLTITIIVEEFVSGAPKNIITKSFIVPTLNYNYDYANEVKEFTPIPGNKYVLSAWVKENEYNSTSYTHSRISLIFANSTIEFVPDGKIIDGWQKIEKEFTIPVTENEFTLKLENTNTSESNPSSFFDDIRIFPFDGNMKSYVYDPVTFKFTAELDNNNYATFYEYDDEGNLNRVKKETARGIMTIKESRNNSKK